MHEPSCRQNPALHSQEALPAPESALSSHIEQRGDPSVAKVPAGQVVHEGSGDFVNPRLQWEHSEIEEAPTNGKCLPAGQAKQVPPSSGHALQLSLVDAPTKSENLPISQFIQVSAEIAPVATEYFPALHSTHILSEFAANAPEYLPAEHVVHTASVEAPTMEECLPGLQSKQVVEALLAVYFPATHLRQLSADEAPATVENVPAEHPTHRVEDDAPSVVKNVPVMQRLQSDAALLPSISEYLPAAQDRQVSWEVAAHSVEYVPLGQSWHDPEPSSENLPAEHSSHRELATAPATAENLPAAHGRHVTSEDAATAKEKVPAEQS